MSDRILSSSGTVISLDAARNQFVGVRANSDGAPDDIGDIGREPAVSPPRQALVSPPGGPQDPDMDIVKALQDDVRGLQRDASGLRYSIEGLKGLMEGFKESLRAVQWGITVVMALGIATLGWMISIGNARLGEMNTRLDRFLERQADVANAANARFDRLLEQRGTAPQAPIIIQVPQGSGTPRD